MTKQRRFTKEFEDEAVRLVTTSGRTQREIAEDLGVGLSTLVRWISRSRDRLAEIPDKAPQADMAAELKRLRRETDGSGKLNSGDKWIADLTAAMLAASRRQDEQGTPPEPQPGVQGEGGVGCREGREDAGRAGAAV